MALRLILLCALSSLVCVAPAARLARTQEQPRAPTSQQTQQRGKDDPAAPAGWKRYSFRYGSGDAFSVVFPQAPEESVTDSDTPDGKLILYVLSSESQKGIYSAVCIEVRLKGGLKLTPELRRQLYETYWSNYVKGFAQVMEQHGDKAEIKPLEAKRVLIGGREGQEQDFTIGNLHGRYRAATGEAQVYVILAISTAGWPSAELESFTDSFKIQSP
jgi:hypothetical protein